MSQAFGTKAETLALLGARGFRVPALYYFEMGQWTKDAEGILASIIQRFDSENPLLAVRSSARSEDSATASMAGAFHSELQVPCEAAPLKAAVERVLSRFGTAGDQVLVQPMLQNVQTAGVIMTRSLDDGSPYYVFNYDDVSGRTDTITGGSMTAKTVHVYKGVSDEDFDSPRLKAALRMVRALEEVFEGQPLDVEFAVDEQDRAWLLQARPICASRHWKPKAARDVSERIRHVEEYVRAALSLRPGFYGDRAILGVMPDWNPAEIIGLVPRPLAFSLYREVITRRVWSAARAHMGYHDVPPTDLMLSVAGRPYIDVRASFNSFLPANLPGPLAHKLVQAWLERLNTHPQLHDKVEFEIVSTVLDFDTAPFLEERYPALLTSEEKRLFLQGLRQITNAALAGASLRQAMQDVAQLEALPLPALPTLASADKEEKARAGFNVLFTLPALLEQCRTWGTLPFSIAARHAFMAESLLRSAVRCGGLSPSRLDAFKRSVVTISGSLSHDFAAACATPERRQDFLGRYGHLRPGTYDILSPSYAHRDNLFDVEHIPQHSSHTAETFVLQGEEHKALQRLLQEAGLQSTPEALLDYAQQAIAGREYAKFVFTRHLSHILESLAFWGECVGLSRAQVALLPLDSILDTLFRPLPSEAKAHFMSIVRREQHLHHLASSFKLSQLLRSARDVYIAPMHRAAPNFITGQRVQGKVVCLSAEDTRADLAGKLVCIESADPGYDWIFTRGIAGLITRFGGANSHMAIRCAEYDLPAAIGCGTLLFEQASQAGGCILDCAGKTLHALGAGEMIL